MIFAPLNQNLSIDMNKKISLLFGILSFCILLGNRVSAQVPTMDTVSVSIDSVRMEAIPVELEDTLSYAEEYKRDAWQFKWGIRGGITQGRLNSTEGQVVRITPNGTPLLQNDRIVRDELVANTGFTTGYSGGVFVRVIRGSFFLQPEVAYTQKGGKFDFLDGNGNLIRRIDAKFNTVDVPILLGIRYRKARVFAGPVLSFTTDLKEDFASSLSPYTNDPLTRSFFESPVVNGMFGLGFEFGQFFFDARYESGLGRYVDRRIGPGSNTTPFNFTADTFSISVGLLR